MNVEIHPRLERFRHHGSGQSRRKYGPDLITEVLLVALEQGVSAAHRYTGVPYDTIKRWVTAKNREGITLQQALDAMDGHPLLRHASPISRERILGERKRQLSLNAECAREAYRIAQRTGAPLSKCIHGVALQRGLSGDKVYGMVMDGRIPEHWIKQV